MPWHYSCTSLIGVVSACMDKWSFRFFLHRHALCRSLSSCPHPHLQSHSPSQVLVQVTGSIASPSGLRKAQGSRHRWSIVKMGRLEGDH
mmetsp:Transcript_31426/g.62072  ORF Transcript_31426/g.62072 Transcript_31426/m.62072 type:complete len:89 (+) Transcript_31426:357-623(+)